MADVEIVIKLSEKNCENLKRFGALWVASENGSSIVSKALLEGTILPKGHGILIDVDELYNSLEFPTKQFASAFKQVLDDAPTIIEADKERNVK